MEYTSQQLDWIDEYCRNDLAKLKRICNPLIARKNVPQFMYDDLYDDAMNVLHESVVSFVSGKAKFETYLISNIHRSFYDWTRDNHRGKRCNLLRNKKGEIIKDEKGKSTVISDISFDAPAEDGIDLREKIVGETAIEINDNPNLKKFMETLTSTEKKIAELIIQGYKFSEIKEFLHISDKQFERHIGNMRCFTKHRLLKHVDDNSKEDTIMSEKCTQTMEKSKSNRLSIASIIKKIDNYTIRFNHPLQRESEQWSNVMKGNLISDILQNNPIPALTFAEQVVNNIAIIWDLDGKQRCTVSYSFKNDGFKISKNVRRYMIDYQANLKDENGNIILDENGFPETESREFDIRNKKFSDLPDELKERFLDYSFEITQYLNCSNEDIAYHIARYNEGKAMNVSQKGIISLGEHFASLVKGIGAMPFFREMGSYKVSELNNGTINRVIIESIMNTEFLDHWNKEQGKMCEFLKENATDETFDNFEDMVNRLTEVIDEGNLEKFNSKDSVIWFGLFAKFIKTGNDDKKFVEFLTEFSQSLHSKMVSGTTYDDVCINKETGRFESNKDKPVLVRKMNILTRLMNDYLHINGTETEYNMGENVVLENNITENNEVDNSDSVIENSVMENENNEVENSTEDNAGTLLDFVKENVNSKTNEGDIEFCEAMLEDLTVEIDNNSKLLEEQNKKSIIALIKYSVDKDMDLDKNGWFADYFKRNADYIKDQKENYLNMVNDLNNYTAA